jgi:hypothetical protein
LRKFLRARTGAGLESEVVRKGLPAWVVLVSVEQQVVARAQQAPGGEAAAVGVALADMGGL